MNVQQGCGSTSLLSFLLVLGGAQVAHAHDDGRVLHVANNGLDSTNCGTRENPCRSISQAITNASMSDTIKVGAGRYGDLNADGDFDDPGDERGDLAKDCLVCITKPLRILSQEGAEVTTIVGTATNPAFEAVVKILASGVTLGDLGHGFTIRRGGEHGVVGRNVAHVRVKGNLALANPQNGFHFEFADELRLTGNVAIANSQGFDLSGCDTVGGTCEATRNVVRGNRALGNSSVGFNVRDVALEFVNNVASNNGDMGMFTIGGAVAATGNALTANGIGLFALPGGASFGSADFTRGTVVGNAAAGFLVNEDYVIAVHETNIYGNGDQPGLTDPGENPVINCGMWTLAEGESANASNNFWGAATGPGPNPADDVCVGGPIVDPVAAAPFPIRP